MNKLHPETWIDIFSDTLYVITDPNAVVAPSPVVESKVEAVAPVAEKVAVPVQAPAPVQTPDAAPQPITSTPSLSSIKAKAVPSEPVVTSLPTLLPEGAYKNGVLILMHSSEAMTESQRALLSKIMGAIQLDLNDCGILKVSSPVDLKHIESLKPRFILSFGLPKDAFYPALPKPYYAIQKHNSSNVLLADSITNIESTVAMKSNLWNSLKEMFGMK